jgi:glycosyltransferase involved in cell wall biosynthesis
MTIARRAQLSTGEPWPHARTVKGRTTGELRREAWPMVEISLVVPMYDEEAVIDAFFARVLPILECLTPAYEVICVSDGSGDGTERLILERHALDPRIKLIALSRHFGKETALSAGLDFASGDVVVPIDADLQDPPELIPRMVEKWREGYDVVLARRFDRQSDTLLKRTTAAWFYRLINRMSEIRIPADTGDFRLLDRRVVACIARMPERMRFMKGLLAWPGFRQVEIQYRRPSRAAGKTKWNYWRLWNLAIGGIVSFSTVPLRIWSYLGIGTALLAILYMSYIVVRTLVFGIDVPGYASLLAVLLFFNGLNLTGLGILGEYLARVFVEVKQRPPYLVDRFAGFEHLEATAEEDARLAGAHFDVRSRTG